MLHVGIASEAMSSKCLETKPFFFKEQSERFNADTDYRSNHLSIGFVRRSAAVKIWQHFNVCVGLEVV